MTTDREKFVPDDQFDREIFLTFKSFSCVMLAVAEHIDNVVFLLSLFSLIDSSFGQLLFLIGRKWILPISLIGQK